MQLEHLLTDEQRALRDMIRKFVEKEILPIRGKMEEDYGLVEGVLQKLLGLGIGRSGDPDEGSGHKTGGRVTEAIICEELARGDAGVSLCIPGMSGGLLRPAKMVGNQAVVDRFAPAFSGDRVSYACISMTDAAGGADTENPLLQGRGISTRATLDGDEWVINGTKSWPTHAGIASVYLTVCTTDPALGEEGVALIYVPPDAEGLSFGKPEAKMGFRTAINASVFYDDVRVPREYRLAGPGVDAHFFDGLAGTGAQWHSSTISLGTARAAFDIALDYTKERKSGGKPVREWSMAAGILADMAIQMEMTRGAVYNLSTMMDHPELYGPPFSPQMVSKASTTKVFAADMAVWVTNKAAELMGSNGISPEYHLEKYLRDAKITQLWLGGQQVSRYRVARGYYNYVV
ncbi:MAG: acyl-CoA dehydrogenase family protein [Deltaproteobacteria bacterium]|nr:acyl-CoA dehydrogenase family protein [Deltaproteobacteria bacterium]